MFTLNIKKAEKITVIATEEDIDLDLALKEKDLEGPLYVEIDEDQILKESGKVKIFR